MLEYQLLINERDIRFVSIDFSQLRDFLTAIAQTDIAELTLKSEDFELVVRKGRIVPPAEVNGETSTTIINTLPQKPVVPASPPSDPSPKEKQWAAITSPMVGTFYRASAPGEAPFVETSDRIRTGQTVCIIEAMKLMNEIETEISGQVMEIVVENGDPIEYGQTLMWIDPE